MDILHCLSTEDVEKISPESLFLKRWLKVPLLIFTTLPAMLSSISELLMKIIGLIIKDGQGASDYFWLLLFVPLLILSGVRTVVYINYGIKYYDQMEVIPIYQTFLMVHNILVGMLCLNELKFYSNKMLCAIGGATILCCLGIYILLEKNRDKVEKVASGYSPRTIELGSNREERGSYISANISTTLP
mmetsp:Transcript_12351/g.15751  ORF Transcript_12351/g.15751 Transcript_12351/m.15751 type:complete len:188 (-) Transcript_12351:83-646(-)